MNKLFIVACKTLGLFQLYWALSSLVSVATAFNMRFMTDEGKLQLNPTFYLVLTIVYSILAFFFAFIMIFKTEAMARLVGLSEKDEVPALPTQTMLMKTGLILLGVFFIFNSVPALVQRIADLYLFIKMRSIFALNSYDAEAWGKLIGTLCQIGLAIWMVLNPEGVVRLISRKKEKALS